MPSIPASSEEIARNRFSKPLARSANALRSSSLILFVLVSCADGVQGTATHCRISALIVRDRLASDTSRSFHAMSRSYGAVNQPPHPSKFRQLNPTESASPEGGTYSRRPYVRSLVWILPNSVVTSCFSVTHVRFVVCLYNENLAECSRASA